MAEFTDEQKKAIETLDKSVLVSAAAGSGKTSVLIERIIRIILEGKANAVEDVVRAVQEAESAEFVEVSEAAPAAEGGEGAAA